MLASLISTGLPIALIIVMTGVGLGLTPNDFRRVAKEPKGFFIGFLGQLILLPLIALFVIKLLGLTGGVAIGLFIIALVAPSLTCIVCWPKRMSGCRYHSPLSLA